MLLDVSVAQLPTMPHRSRHPFARDPRSPYDRGVHLFFL